MFLAGCAAQPARNNLDRLYAAEDARPTTTEGLAPIFALLDSTTEPTTLAVAVRAVGRLQRPAFVDSLTRFLTHRDAAVRAEAANAIAQSVQPGRDTAAVMRARTVLHERLLRPNAATDLGVLARSIGRLPHESPAVAVAVGEDIARAVLASPDTTCRVRPAASVNAAPGTLYGATHGIYAVARRARSLGCFANALAQSALHSRTAGDTAVWTRELALLALQAANQADAALLAAALRDGDPRVRRLGLRIPRDAPPAFIARVAEAGLADTASMVRIDAVRTLGTLRSPEGCAIAIRSMGDAAVAVRIEAVDAVATTCRDTIASPILDSLVRLLPHDTTGAQGSWHIPARALIALARTSPTRATPHFGHFRMHPVWQVRAALGAAARATNDSSVLLDLLSDRDANVREETITHLAQMGGTLRERAVRAGLAATEYQVVLAAATAAESVATIDASTLAAALGRLTTKREETSRDPRRELLERIAQRGTRADAALLRPYLRDFDTLIARRAAEVLTGWTGSPVQPSSTSQSLAASATATTGTGRLYLRITISEATGGGRILVRLFADETPATVARVAQHARDGYYEGRTFHRVVPNFVIQGGSPDANEYVGDGPYMRDELGLRSHTRGTLGISTRGRDTGDAQIFVNLIDNFRLDHDYTVFGEVVEGMDVVARIGAGAVMRKVEVVSR